MNFLFFRSGVVVFKKVAIATHTHKNKEVNPRSTIRASCSPWQTLNGSMAGSRETAPIDNVQLSSCRMSTPEALHALRNCTLGMMRSQEKFAKLTKTGCKHGQWRLRLMMLQAPLTPDQQQRDGMETSWCCPTRAATRSPSIRSCA